MGKMENEVTDISTPEKQASTESHYHSKKDRIFVRGIQGQYSLKDELKRLREALLMSSADNYVLRNWGMNTMAWAEDDLEIVQAMAAEKGIALPQAGVNRELCRMLKPRRFKLEEYGK